ncbi:hypothetical protein GYMLUDRAFT_157660, partial [Collybiopsis luxurians FD-317 M1]
NAVEQIFGVMKARWEILSCPPHFDLSIQAHSPPALAALHYFICEFDPSDIEDCLKNPLAFSIDAGNNVDSFATDLARGVLNAQERAEAEKTRSEIAHAMWAQYQEWLQEHGLNSL